MRLSIEPTGVERFFSDDSIIVSKTDPKGLITYANRVFVEISGFSEAELLGKPHNIVRHPDMPGAVFRLLWQTISGGKEIFAYVKNMACNGDHYWVFAHVTPTRDELGEIIGYHSNRRVPARPAVKAVSDLYQEILTVERKYPNRAEGIQAGMKMLERALSKSGMLYEEFIFAV